MPAMSAATRAYMFWDYAIGTVPSGWTVDTDYNAVFIRAVPSSGASITTGGSDSHYHTLSGYSCSTPSATISAVTSTNAVASLAHTHAQGTVTCDANNILPGYYNFAAIYIDCTVPTWESTQLVANLITFFKDISIAPTADWTFHNNSKFSYFRTNTTVAGQAGGNHYHTLGGTMGTPSATANSGTTSTTLPTSTHTHTVTSIRSTVSAWAPDFVAVAVYKCALDRIAINDKTIKDAFVMGFNGTPPGGWIEISTVGSNFENRLVYSSSVNAAATGGAAHAHAAVNPSYKTTGTPSANAAGRVTVGSNFPGNAHTHTIGAAFDSVASSVMPAYRDMVFAYLGGRSYKSVYEIVSAGDTATTGPNQYPRTLSDELIYISTCTSEKAAGAQSYSTSIAEITSLTDSLTTRTLYGRSLSDTLTDGDSVTRVVRRSRIYYESVIHTDTPQRRFSPSRTLSDTVTDSDIFSEFTRYIRTLSDNTTGTDTFSKVPNFKRSLSESVIQTDSWSKRYTIGRTLSDTVTDSDTFSETSRFLRSLTDGTSLTDTTSKGLSASRSFTETLTGADSYTKGFLVSRAFSEGFTLADTWSEATRFTRQYTESMAGTDTYTKQTRLGRTFTDGFTVADTWSEVTRFQRSYFESIVNTDTPSKRIVIARSFSDAITGTDTFAEQTRFLRSFTDILTETATPTSQSRFIRTFTDGVINADSRTTMFVRSIAESLTLLDSRSQSGRYGRQLSEIANLEDVFGYSKYGAHYYSTQLAESVLDTESIFRQARVSKTLQDGTTYTDSFQRTVRFGRAISEIITESDTLSKAFAKILSDTTTENDSISRLLLFQRILSEIVTQLDTLSKMFSITKSDTLTEADTFSRLWNVRRSLNDTLTEADTVYRLLNLGRTLNEIITELDTFSRLLNVRRLLPDNILSTDSYLTREAYTRSLTDTLTESDILSRIAEIHRTLNEAMSSGDSYNRADKRPLSDLITLTDNWSRAAGLFFRTPSQPLSITDGITYSTTGLKFQTLNETVTLEDLYTRTFRLSKTIADTFISTDTYIKSTNFVRIFTDGITELDNWSHITAFSRSLNESLSDADSRQKGVAKQRTEALTLSDTYSELVRYTRTISDIFTLTDGWNYDKTGNKHWEGYDTVQVSDTFSYMLNTSRILSESILETDSRLRMFGRTISESLSGGDTKQMRDAKIFSDLYTLADSLAESTNFVRTLYDTNTLVDTWNYVKSAPGFSSYASEILALGDVLTRQFRGRRTLYEEEPLSDTRNFALKRVLSDSTALLDSRGGYTAFSRIVADTIVSVDLNATKMQYVRTTSEDLAAADSYARSTNLRRTASETLVSSDQKTSTINFIRYISESMVTVDQLTKGLNFDRILYDSLVVTDQWQRGMIRFNYLFGDGFTFSEFIQGTFPKSKKAKIYFKFRLPYPITYEFGRPVITDLKYKRIGTAAITYRGRI